MTLNLLKQSLIICFFLPSITFADCSVLVQPIKQGQQAPCDGFHFTPEAEKVAADARITANALTVKTKLQAEENAILEQRLKLYMDATTNLSKEVASRDSSESFIRIVYFAMGALVVGVSMRNLHP